MKTKIVALAGMLVLSLITSVALAGKTDPADKYVDSLNGTVTSGVIKSLRNCPDGTDAFFKNVNPFISGGPGGNPGELQWDGTFLVDGTNVTLFVWWKDDNSFRYEVQNGIMEEIGAEIDSDKLIYKHGSPVFEDSGLNVLKVGGDSAAVNHLDICLSLVDTTPPVIEFISPLDADTVSGMVTVIVTVTDESGVNTMDNPVTVSIDGQSFTMDCTPLSQEQYRCEYELDTEPLPAGLYDITVQATDLAEPSANTVTVSINVELVKSLAFCFGILGDEDFGGDPTPDGYANGCNPTGKVNVQAPPDTAECNVQDPPPYCFLSGNLLKPDPAKILGLQDCGEYGFPDPRMKLVGGRWVPDQIRDLKVFDEVGIDPALEEGVVLSLPANSILADAVVLDQYTYGFKGCFVVAQHVKGAILDTLYPVWPQTPPTGLVFIKTHFPEEVLDEQLLAKCYGTDGNFDLQDAGGAGYSPVDQQLSVEQNAAGVGTLFVATQKCVNPSRTLTRNNGFDVSNIVETEGLPFDPNDPAQGFAVLDFKYQLAEMKFAALFTALANAEPTLLTGKFSDVSSPVNQAKAQFNNGTEAALERAIGDLTDAADAIRTKTTWMVQEANWPGDALARIENLIWRLTKLREELTRLEAL